MTSPERQFTAAITAYGLMAPYEVIQDGEIHRFQSNEKSSNKNGWYVFYDGDIPSGTFGCWTQNTPQHWRKDVGRELTVGEKEDHRIKVESLRTKRLFETAKRNAEAKETALEMWTNSSQARDHPYLKKKQVKPHHSRQIDQELILPIYIEGELQSLQRISALGDKRFLTGRTSSGGYNCLGKISPKKTLHICEGWATGATIFEATGHPVAIAFSKDNLEDVANHLRNKYPEIKITICADDDWQSPNNPGLSKAMEVAQKIKALVVVPRFSNTRANEDTDFNDMANMHGLESVKRTILEIKVNQESTWILDWPKPTELQISLEVLPFNYQLLPKCFRDWVRDISERMQCPPDFAAVGAMVAASSLIGSRATIQPKEKDSGWQECPNLWGAIVGRPGIMKTPALKEVLKPISEIQKRENLRLRKEILDWEESCLAIEKNKDKDASKPVKPIGRDFKVDDSTVEALQIILANNPWGTMSYREELIGLLKDMDKKGQESARAFYLTSWSGDLDYSVKRVSRDSVYIPRVCLSILGGIQPAKLDEYIKSAVTFGNGDDGLIQRFGMLVAPIIEKEFVYIDREPDEEARAIAWAVFERLSKLTPHGDEPQRWTLSSKAQAMFLEWFIPLNKELRSETLHLAMVSHLSKYRKLIPAIALVNALIDTPEKIGVVVEIEMARALEWGDYLRSHAEKIYQVSVNPELDGAKALLDKIKNGKVMNGFTPRVISQNHWSGLDSVDLVKKACGLLVECGHLRMQELKTGGRPSEIYLINPVYTNED